MANRYRNNRFNDYGRYGENRRRSGRNPRSESGRYSSDYDNERSGGAYDFGGSDFDYDREENYFGGGGNLGYGSGYTGMEYDRGYSSYDRSYEEDSMRFNQPSRTYTGGYGYDSNYDRSGTYGGFDRDYDNRYGRGYSSGRNYGRREYEGDFERDQNYRSNRNYRRDDRGWWDKASDEVASWFGDEQAERRRRMDERRYRNRYSGDNHRGRGPRNYQRSDERIHEDINDKLTDDYYLDASNIEVEVENGDVVLTGTVETRFAKRRAEDLAEEVSGVGNVENRVRVDENFYASENSTFTDDDTDTIYDTDTTKSRSKSA